MKNLLTNMLKNYLTRNNTHCNICIRKYSYFPDHLSYYNDIFLRNASFLSQNKNHLPFSERLLKLPSTCIYWPKYKVINSVIYRIKGINNLETHIDSNINFGTMPHIIFYVPNVNDSKMLLDKLKISYNLRISKDMSSTNFNLLLNSGCYHYFLETLGLELFEYMHNDIKYFKAKKSELEDRFKLNHKKYYEKFDSSESFLLNINPLFNLNYFLYTNPNYSESILNSIKDQTGITHQYIPFPVIYIPILCQEWL